MIAAGDTTKQKAADSAWRNWRREEENERSEVSPQLRTEGSRIAVYTRAVAVTTVVRMRQSPSSILRSIRSRISINVQISINGKSRQYHFERSGSENEST